MGRSIAVAFGITGMLAASLPITGLAGDGSTNRGADDCLNAEVPLLDKVTSTSAVIRYIYTDSCYFPAEAYLQSRERQRGNWKEWLEKERVTTTRGFRLQREVRLGHLESQRRYQARAGLTYFGSSETAPVEYETEFPPYKDTHLTATGTKNEVRMKAEWTTSPYGERRLLLERRGGPVGNHWRAFSRLGTEGCRISNGAAHCERRFSLEVYRRSFPFQDDLIRGEDAEVRMRFSNPPYASFERSNVVTKPIKLTAGDDFEEKVGLEESK